MTPVTSFSGQRVFVFGLGGSGLATALALIAGGAHVTAWDDGEKGREAAHAAGVPVADLREQDWHGVDALVLSPGVPLTHPEPHWSVYLARAAGVEIIGDIELFVRERRSIAPDAPFIAITGTNGKSTTTVLIAHILREAGYDVQLGGNIGTAILSLEPPSPARVHVVECSSFQIDLTPTLDPTVGIHLNLTPDHIDRHGSMELYAAIKERLVAASGTAIIGVDDGWSAAIAERVAAAGRHVVPVSVRQTLATGFSVLGDKILRDGVAVADLAGIGSLRGRHNAQNAAAAFAAVTAIGVSDADAARGLATFPGLAHRMEAVGRAGNVLFVNDSKATNADAAAKALGSFDRIFWIVGGRPKEGGIASLTEYFPKIIHAYLIGESSPDFARTLDGVVPYTLSGTLDQAVVEAARAAGGDGAGEAVVLLSPACASYDQFPNFEVRGNRFREAVQALPQVQTDLR
ncbi:UDP-N-acetylmuramoyl-L-alanine--D-glutamate ligase [Pseudochelatococcus contaminans]|uniref:UDP-N-acetylmuramoylalanine--D-glutamate ligase n=1 Tax=Pseudochelatococcus contaminans TaxID=1538103 RepID=A0A7W5Z1B4_9HYPH|nr:UDP-N-acetylmuramoyl-L-alanine--D-glutamate ligase [Pseudochelatococcus contaminans]MBB3808255.1 UDP-N-acetylmuramoylalanine--D-glutamate ligase [Pseudochelatococcus contaminans]